MWLAKEPGAIVVPQGKPIYFRDLGIKIQSTSDGNLLIEADTRVTIGVAGDILLGDSTERDMKPSTTAKINLGTAAAQFNNGFFDGTVQTDALRIDEGGSTSISSGTGTVKMTSANNANNSTWIPISYNGATCYIPAWTSHAP